MEVPRLPTFDLTGKRALITGGSRGIGFGAAAALAAAGAQVTVAARTVKELDAAGRALRDAGYAAFILPLDIEKLESVRSLVMANGPFDILVNNAGCNRRSHFLDVTPEDFDAVMSLNVRAAFFVAQAVAEGMKDRGIRGSIINMSSQAGRAAVEGRPVYTTSKFAIEGLTRAMAVDLAPMGIRVNAICPTFIETELTRSTLSDPEFRQSVVKKIRLGRIGQVEDLLGSILLLASDASSMMTGASLVVDGGWTA